MHRDDEPRIPERRNDLTTGDPHRDVTGALHDVSNALTVLLGWVAEVRAGGASREQVERALGIVEQHARAARDLARRAIGGDAAIDYAEEPLDSVVAGVVEALSVEANRAGVSLAVVGATQGVLVPHVADASQILTNVLLNAIAWSPPGSRVTIETAADAVVAHVLVRDEGPGIPAAQAPFIFDGGSSREGGAGVGLRHARAIAQAAGGDLELLTTTAPGKPATKGARFKLRWPRVEATLPRAPVSAPRPAMLAGTRVLVVEDDADVATLLESALGSRGARVIVARNAQELVARASESHDVALVDLSPIAHDVSGAIAALRKGSPDLALVFISGSAVGLPEGLDGDERTRWIRKPFEVGEIVTALAETRAAVKAAAGR